MTINTHTIDPNSMTELLPTLFTSKFPIMMFGKPGVGKSTLVKVFAKKNNLKLYDLRLTTVDAVDLRGLQYIDDATKRTIYFVPEFYPTAESLAKEGYAGAIIFLDEITSAEPRLQAASYELLLDRRLGSYSLPDNCAVWAAGNSTEDGAVAYEMGSALADRLIIFNVISDSVQWVKWATTSGIHSQVTTFIKIKPQYLNSGDGETATGNEDDNLIKPTSRSWEKVSDMLKLTNDRDKLHYIIPGIVGKIAAAEFFHVLEELSELPPIEELLKATGKKLTSMLPTSIAAMYGLTYSLHGYCTNLEDSIAAVNVLNTLASIEDDKPRVEIQTLGVELLLENVVYTDWMQDFLMSTEYKSYRTQSKELVDLLVKNKGARK